MSVLKEKIIKEDGSIEWKPVSSPPGGDTLPIGSILEISDDMEIPYGWELVENVEKISNYQMLNNCEIVTEVEPVRILKSDNLISLNCVLKVPNTFNKEEALNVMKLSNNLAPKNNIYKITGVGSTDTFGYRINSTATLILLTDGTIRIRVNDDNIKYVIIDLNWILED